MLNTFFRDCQAPFAKLFNMKPKKTAVLGFRVSPELKQALELAAERRDAKVAQIVVKALEEWLTKQAGMADEYPDHILIRVSTEERNVVLQWRKFTRSQQDLMLRIFESGILELRKSEPAQMLNDEKRH
jgi:hypothetical protein